QNRQAMVHRCPEHAGLIIQIAVGLDIDHEPSASACREGCTGARTGSVSHPARPLRPEVAVRSIMLPELTMMRAREGTRARETPVLSHDEGAELGVHARRARGR